MGVFLFLYQPKILVHPHPMAIGWRRNHFISISLSNIF